MNNTVGITLAFVDGGRPKCRLEECQFGNFITDAMAEEMKVDIAVINSGGIKGSFDQGRLSYPFQISILLYSKNGHISLLSIYFKANQIS